MRKKVIIFGGTGFVGTHVTLKALERGYDVIVASRAGVPHRGTILFQLQEAMRAAQTAEKSEQLQKKIGMEDLKVNSPTKEEISESQKKSTIINDKKINIKSGSLEFVALDALHRSQVFNFFHDHANCTAVVSAIGKLTRDEETARRINGDCNVNISAAVCHEKLCLNVKKYVFVSAHPYNNFLRLLNHRLLLRSYFEGKKAAELSILENVGDKGVIMRPGFIFGTREIWASSGGLDYCTTIPIWVVGKPLEKILTPLGGTGLLTPPVDVEVLSESIMRSIDWAHEPHTGLNIHGIVDTKRMHEICGVRDLTSTYSNQ